MISEFIEFANLPFLFGLTKMLLKVTKLICELIS